MARPVVATAIGPSAELLGPQAGLVVPTDASALARALGELLASPERREAMGLAGRRRVEACFTLERQAAAMLAVYEQAALTPLLARA